MGQVPLSVLADLSPICGATVRKKRLGSRPSVRKKRLGSGLRRQESGVVCGTLRSMGKAQDFAFTTRKNGEVVITHDGRVAATLRGRQAERFLARVDADNAQDLMARLTGNYKRGNERR